MPMSEIHYDAHPSMVRIRPFSTPLMVTLLLAGILFAVMGPALIPVPLPEPLDERIVKIAGVVVAGLALLQLCIWWLATRSDHLVIRDDELVWTHGLLSKNYTEIKLSSVRTVRLHQSLLQRILNAGDIKIYTSGDDPELVVRGLPNPNHLRELIKRN
jgi:uncharacterized membrane protein YdbT with pleckstrin-like domain